MHLYTKKMQMETMPFAATVQRSGEPSKSPSFSLVGKALPQPCTANPFSSSTSVMGGLTTASVANANTTFALESSTSPIGKGQLSTKAGEGGLFDAHVMSLDKASMASAAVAAADVPVVGIVADYEPPEQQQQQYIPFTQSTGSPSHAMAHTTHLPASFVKHDDEDTLSLSPLACGTSHMCCGPPPLVASAEARRATSAATFLGDDVTQPSTAVPPEVEELPDLSPEEVTLLPGWCGNRISVPSTLVYPPPLADAAATTAAAAAASPNTQISSPAGVTAVSSTTCSPATTVGTSVHHSRTFETPLPNCSTFVSPEDVISGDRHGERATASFSKHQPIQTEGFYSAQPLPPQQRHGWPHGSSVYGDPSDPNVTLSALTAPVTSNPVVGAAAATTTARVSDDGSAGLFSLRNRTSPHSLSEGGATTTGASTVLPRVTSLETVATLSSTRSRPALTPAATGLPGTGTSTVGSAAASTTMTSVTYTRKNVSLGALDFYGNPVMSLSTLLAQMSVRSGDRDEMEQLELCHNTQQQQQQQKNTLSMQNLKAHTQQVGVMGPEDKIKRLRGRSETAVTATASVLRRRRPSCPAPGFPTGRSSPTVATLGGRSQVDCLKDVLQECNFLCINDVINAIAETQAHELREAQQQLEAGSTMTRTTAGPMAPASTTATAAATEASTTALAEAAETAAMAKTTTTTKGESITGAVEGATTVPPGIPLPLPVLQRTASLSLSACSEDGCSSLVRNAASASFIASATGLPASADMIDPQRALSLAAAITEVSLNLERGPEVSSSASNQAATAIHTQRSHFLRPASGRTATCSTGDGTTPSVASGSLPNLTSNEPMAAPHTHTGVTPVQQQQRTTASLSSRALSSPSEVLPYAHVVAIFPEDPLERNMLRSSSSRVTMEANRSTASGHCGGSPATLSQVTQRNDAAAVESPAAAATREKCFGGKAKSRASPWPFLAGRYVPSWHGLSANSEEAVTAPRQGEGYTSVNSSCNSPLKVMLAPRSKDDSDCLAKSFIGDIEELGGDCAVTMTGGSSQEPAGTSNSATEVRVMVESMACTSFDDELTTVRELRKWAKCVALQENVQPSTETEVTT